ncbi:hypothetical protein LOD99_7101 [Oopsacas minuta]|uniref:Uncharacterized protein n=1 Tax=Oopsacas minuta TaxID=111878 RepID=A0AAV7JJ12_9METZ|nr:hypothetical protein LOD99_7101 [Oopsacas minuta]
MPTNCVENNSKQLVSETGEVCVVSEARMENTEVIRDRKGERKRDRSREGSVENSKDAKRKRNEDLAPNTDLATKESSGIRTPKLNLKREPFVGAKHTTLPTNAQPKEGKPILLQKKKRDDFADYSRKYPPSDLASAPAVTQSKKKATSL